MTFALQLQTAPQGTDNWQTVRTHQYATDAGREQARAVLLDQQDHWIKSQQFPNHQWRIQ